MCVCVCYDVSKFKRIKISKGFFMNRFGDDMDKYRCHRNVVSMLLNVRRNSPKIDRFYYADRVFISFIVRFVADKKQNKSKHNFHDII